MPKQSLYTSPIEDVTYEMVEEFCQLSIVEDIDLDYKSDWPNDLSKLICAFANTQGGLILIGIEEEDKTRKPKFPPTGVEGDVDALRQRARNIGIDAVFPPVTTEVHVCEIPKSIERKIIVIRISPSRLMHAVDRRRRVYIRIADSNRGYELASIKDLEWLWEQRKEQIEVSQTLLKRAIQRADSAAISWNDQEAQNNWEEFPRLYVSFSPDFPSLHDGLDVRKLMKYANSRGVFRSSWKDLDRTLPWGESQWRTVPEGIALKDRGIFKSQQYIELNKFGLSFFVISLELRSSQNSDEQNFVNVEITLSYIDLILRLMSDFYNEMDFRWSGKLQAWLNKIDNRQLEYYQYRSSIFSTERLGMKSPDEKINLLSKDINTYDIEPLSKDLLFDIADKLFWAFGVNWSKEKLEEWFVQLSGYKMIS